MSGPCIAEVFFFVNDLEKPTVGNLVSSDLLGCFACTSLEVMFGRWRPSSRALTLARAGAQPSRGRARPS